MTKRDERRMLLSFLDGSRRFFLLGVLAALGMTFCDMLIPQMIRTAVDAGLGGTAPENPDLFTRAMFHFAEGRSPGSHLGVTALAVVAAALLGAFLRWFSTLENVRGGEALTKNMQDRLYSHVARLPMSWHSSHAAGDIIQRCTSDVTMIREFCTEQLYNLVRIILLIALALTFMFSMQVSLTLAALAFIPVIVGYSAFFHGKVGNQFLQCDENEGVLSTIAQENLTGVRVVRAFGAEAREDARFRAQNDVYTNAWMKLCLYLAGFWAFGDIVSGLQVLTVVVLGALFCVRGEMTVGSYLAFISYTNMLVWPIRALGRLISEMSKSGVSLHRICDIMSAEAEDTDAPGEEAAGENPAGQDITAGDISFEHVSFSFGGAEVLSDITFTVKEGDTVGILGGTGSGKSTLMHLLAGLYKLPEGQGRILIGGKDIRSVPLPALRHLIGIVLQEPFLFSRTIGENIGITGRDDPETIRRVTRIAALEDTIREFPQGLDTMVGERGVTLSGGQKQRVAIARTLTLDAPVLIFDDSLSAVDAETDSRIRRSLRENVSGSTVFLISHRISTLMRADRIYVLDRGKIAEEGTHEELLQKDGLYAEIFRMQSLPEGGDHEE